MYRAGNGLQRDRSHKSYGYFVIYLWNAACVERHFLSLLAGSDRRNMSLLPDQKIAATVPTNNARPCSALISKGFEECV